MQPAFHVVIALALAAALASSGCTDSVAPREPYGDPFAVYGLLTPDRDTQFVWVFPIEEFPTLGTPDALEDVSVTSTDLETGELRVWQDTVIVRANGQHEFLYRAPFRAAFDRRYRVAVQRADEPPAWAEVRIPPPVDVEVVDAGRDTVTVEVIGEDISAMKTEVEYHVRAEGPKKPDTSYFRQYWSVQKKIAGGWRVKIRFNIDRYWVEAWYFADFYPEVLYSLCPQLLLGDMRVHILVGDASWDPRVRAFDPYILAQPGTMQNVENGTGFIGGGYRIDADLDVPKEAVEAACFIYCESPFENCDIPDAR